jgi:uncharacterized protein (TIGR00369 family)
MNPIYYEKLLEFMNQIPFNRWLGIEVVSLEPGFARMELPYRKELVGDISRPALHGGVTSTLLDTCGGAALITNIEPVDRLSTVDLRIDYLRPGACERVIVEARVLRVGNRVGVCDMIAYQSDGRDAPIAIGRGVYNVIRRPD